jgi:hypothetical protein
MRVYGGEPEETSEASRICNHKHVVISGEGPEFSSEIKPAI